MSWDVLPTLIVIGILILTKLFKGVCLEINVSMGDKGAVGTIRDFCNLPRVVDTDIFEMVQICQGCIIDSINLTLNARALRRDIKQIGGVIPSANDKRVAGEGTKVADVGGAVEKVAVGEATLEGAVDEDVVVVGTCWMARVCL